VDFIDMEDEGHREALLEELKRALANDRARSLASPVGPFGLVQLTRKRTERSLERALTRPCPTCDGLGRVKSPETVCLEIRRALLREAAQGEVNDFAVRAHPEVVHLLSAELRSILIDLKERYGINVRTLEAPDFHPARFEIG
jgi:ribonuclease G